MKFLPFPLGCIVGLGIGIQGMSTQGQALQQCQQQLSTPPPATNRTPRRFRL